MKDKLRALIDENRDGFDELEPSPAIWQGIRQRMGFKAPVYRITLPPWLQAAAMLVFASAILLLVASRMQPVLNSPAMARDETADFPIEIQEAGMYYGGTLNRYLKEMEALKADTSKAGKMVYEQLATLDSAFNALLKESVETGGHQRVFEALILNYRLRIELMEHFIENYPLQNKQNETNL